MYNPFNPLHFLGFDFIEDPLLIDSVQWFFPKTKKKRIQRKCAKKCRKIVPSRMINMLQHDGTVTLVAHPAMIVKIRRAIVEGSMQSVAGLVIPNGEVS